MKYIILIPLIIFISSSFGQRNPDQKIVQDFNKLAETPNLITFQNKKPVNNKGGHLQGVQLYQNKYALLSGSSDSYAYLIVVKMGTKNEVFHLHRLMEKPFKHAGGIQIYENYLAVGIEDNDKKDKSKVCIYDISEIENKEIKLIAQIDRNGKPGRSTAGCIGITNYNNEVLLTVGDWDTKNLDFYSCPIDKISEWHFEKIQTLNTERILKNDWSDKNWYAYQNINLVNIENNLFFVGLGHDNHGKDLADVFKLNMDKSDNFSLQKLATKTFNCTKKSNFKAGAGVVISNEGKIEIVSCAYNINDLNYLNYFGILTEK